MKKNNKKGFTLVELVIVVAVMAVLVAVAIPTVSSITGEARTAVAESNAKTIESVIKLEEANLTKTNATLTTESIAIALFEAKLGIEAESVFYYNPTTGAVYIPDAEDLEEESCVQITFNEDGGTTLGAMPGSTSDKGGTYAEVTAEGKTSMKWTKVS